MLHLQGRVLETKALREHRGELTPSLMAIAFRPDEHVSGERREAAADRPDVQVVDLDNIRDGEHRLGDLVGRHLAWGDLEQDPRRLPQQDRAGPEDQTCNGEARKRIEPVPAGDENEGAGDRRSRKRCEIGRASCRERVLLGV